MVSDESRYSITRRAVPRVRTIDAVEPLRPVAEVPPVVLDPDSRPPQLAVGSRTALKVPDAAPAPGQLNLKVEYGDVELTIEHRGDEVSIVIPGALRLRAPRAQAMALIAALMKRP